MCTYYIIYNIYAYQKLAGSAANGTRVRSLGEGSRDELAEAALSARGQRHHGLPRAQTWDEARNLQKKQVFYDNKKWFFVPPFHVIFYFRRDDGGK